MRGDVDLLRREKRATDPVRLAFGALSGALVLTYAGPWRLATRRLRAPAPDLLPTES